MKTNNKMMKSVMAFCCGLMVCAGFASCSSDDDDFGTPKDNGDNTELATAEIVYKVSLGKHELDIDDVVVKYTDKEGKQQTMTMTENEWTWRCSLNTNDIPKIFELRVEPKRKDNLNLDKKAEYETGCVSKIIVTVRNRAGRVICECDGMGIYTDGFSKLTGEDIMNPWNSTVTGWLNNLTNVTKKTLEVYPKKIEYNGMCQKYW